MTMTDHTAIARSCLAEAERLCDSPTREAEAQVHATIGVGHALLAIADQLRGMRQDHAADQDPDLH